MQLLANASRDAFLESTLSLHQVEQLVSMHATRARGLKLLMRYTNKTFVTKADWLQWLDDRRDRLFFTECGGFKFIVDAADNLAESLAMGANKGTQPAHEQPVLLHLDRLHRSGLVCVGECAGGTTTYCMALKH